MPAGSKDIDMHEQTQLIVGDVGGTNGRFSVANLSETGELLGFESSYSYLSADFSSLRRMLKAYLQDLGPDRPDRARLAIAGPTTDREGHLTNLGWAASARKLEQELELGAVHFLNDFQALAFSAPCLNAGDSVVVKEGLKASAGPISVMGPGTGFGVSLLLPVSKFNHVISTEGGHMTYSPVSELEVELGEYLKARVSHVSVESLLCGNGLSEIYGFLQWKYKDQGPKMTPPEVTVAAMEGHNELAREAVSMFVAILGSAAGDIALVHGATGGVYLGGGILPRIQPLLLDSDFAKRFVDKGPMQDYLEQIPVELIVANNAALIGSAVSAGYE